MLSEIASLIEETDDWASKYVVSKMKFFLLFKDFRKPGNKFAKFNVITSRCIHVFYMIKKAYKKMRFKWPK